METAVGPPTRKGFLRTYGCEADEAVEINAKKKHHNEEESMAYLLV